MAYRELPLHGRPAQHVACVWTRDPEPAPRTRRILPDACVDVVWVEGDRLAVAGPATGPVLAALPAGARAAGVRFRVDAADGGRAPRVRPRPRRAPAAPPVRRRGRLRAEDAAASAALPAVPGARAG